ncbi:response regulator [Parendozoicomonas haliclonae]|uniref:Transcriptional regulatory protein QseB n=1 Tax=Parendozoicomonas haliclonae TaxID=1960125 RepID=A0A1X7AQY6_9GAMM|nr:response regulator transcription factor [Parendozoicomonas haliclonae]SMA50509.1 Transcriptional regulatory protein QseB [Parendozoicomonas haliclonae]
MKILLIEDDELIAQGIVSALSNDDTQVIHCPAAQPGLQLIHSPEQRPDLVILDLGLPDKDGMDVLGEINHPHHQTNHLPVLVLTARDTLAEKVRGLDRGADDYLTKPFELEELQARIRMLARRFKLTSHPCLKIGQVTLDTASYTVTVSGQTHPLPRREFALLQTLMENPGRIFSREHLIDRMYNWDEEVSSNSVDVHIHNLRKKVGTDFIRSIRGVGWLV